MLGHINKIPGSIVIPESNILEATIPNYDFTTNQCDESDNESSVSSLDEYTKQFIITDKSCNVKLKISKILENMTCIDCDYERIRRY